MKERRIALVTLGTLGDLHPFIAAARCLKARGYDAVVASSPHYRENVVAAGLTFHPIRPTVEQILQDLHMERAEFARHVMADPSFMFKHVLGPYLKVAYEDLLPLIDGAALVVTSSLAFSARLAAERLRVPQIGIVLQPLMFLSAYDPPHIPRAPWFHPLTTLVGPRVTGGLLRLLKKAIVSGAKPVHALRREVGLPPSDRDPMFDGQSSGNGAIALYSGLLGGLQPDYPPHTSIAGFAFYDGEADGVPLSPRLQKFLDTGPSPLVFTLGSFATEHAGSFYEVSAAAARRLKKRAVLLVGPDTGQPRFAQGGEDLFVCDYAPYSQLFPHAEVITHQGGIGTVAQALRSGRPQLVVPFFADQPDNAARVLKLGVGRTLPRKRYRLSRVVDELATLLSDSACASRASAIGGQVARENGAAEAARLIDSLLTTRQARRAGAP